MVTLCLIMKVTLFILVSKNIYHFILFYFILFFIINNEIIYFDVMTYRFRFYS